MSFTINIVHSKFGTICVLMIVSVFCTKGHPDTAKEMRIPRLTTDDLLVAQTSVTIEARNLVFRAER